MVITSILIATLWIIWCICGILAYGLSFAYFQRQYPSMAEICVKDDRLLAIAIAITGPIGLLVCLISGGTRYGFKWR